MVETSGSPDWAMVFLDKLKEITCTDWNYKEWESKEFSKERFGALLDGHDINDLVALQSESRSVFHHGSFGDPHHGQTDFQAEATLFAVICFLHPWAVNGCLELGADLQKRSASLRYYHSQDLKDSDKRTEIILKDFLPGHLAQISDSGFSSPMFAGSELLSATASETCGEFEFYRKSHHYCGDGYRSKLEGATCAEIASLMKQIDDQAEHISHKHRGKK